MRQAALTLEEGLQLRWIEAKAFLDVGIALEVGSGGDATSHPLDRNHGTVLGDKGGVCVRRGRRDAGHEVCLDSHFLQELKDCAVRSGAQLRFALHLVCLGSITSGDAILVQDVHQVWLVLHLVYLLRLAFDDKVTDV